MLDKFHLQRIEDLRLTAEQWEIIHEFVTHNFGAAIMTAVSGLIGASRGQMSSAEMLEYIDDARARYFETVGTMKELARGEHRQDACATKIEEGSETDGEGTAQGRERGEAARAGAAD